MRLFLSVWRAGEEASQLNQQAASAARGVSGATAAAAAAAVAAAAAAALSQPRRWSPWLAVGLAEATGQQAAAPTGSEQRLVVTLQGAAKAASRRRATVTFAELWLWGRAPATVQEGYEAWTWTRDAGPGTGMARRQPGGQRSQTPS